MSELVLHTIRPSARLRLVGLGALALILCVAFMSVGLRGNIAFVLELRAQKLAALIVVAIATAVGTIIFQTVCANRILTPSIMGLDALYVLCQTALLFLLTGFGFASIDPQLAFGGNIAAMMGLALALFLPMLGRRTDLGLLLLTGVVLGILFRSITTLIARLIDPNEFAVLQGSIFASFETVRPELLVFSGVVSVAGAAIAWRGRHVLDVIALGRDSATGLGVEWRRAAAGWLMLVAALVAVSTALVGPLTFLGLLVAALAERIVDTRRHAILLPAAALVAVIVLVGGQTLLQHVLGGEGTLGIVVEFAGGIVFLMLLLRAVR